MASRAAARRRQAARVIVVDMASGASSGYVSARKGKSCLRVVIEDHSCCPRSGVVAACAIRKRKSGPGRGMRRIVRLLPG
jgi:hypothetical protein